MNQCNSVKNQQNTHIMFPVSVVEGGDDHSVAVIGERDDRFEAENLFKKGSEFVHGGIPSNARLANTEPYQDNQKLNPLNKITKSNMCASQQKPLSRPNDIPNYIESPSDDDSVSTMGSSDEPRKLDRNRSIFGTYWGVDEKGSPATPPIRKLSLNTMDTEESTISRYADSIRNSRDWSSYLNDEVLKTEKDSSRKCDSDGYEAYLKINEAGRTVLPSAASLKDSRTSQHTYLNGNIVTPGNSLNALNKQHFSRRRRIFRQTSGQKTCSLPTYGYMYTQPSKGKVPLPCLLHNKKMLRSSLRDRNLSLAESLAFEESALSSQSRPSVSFETKVTIHEYEKPVQQVVHDGWSERFAV